MARQASKIDELVEWEHIDYVDEMLDNGESKTAICNWINDNGFRISLPLIYEYEKLRKKKVAEVSTAPKVINPIKKVKRTPIVTTSPTFTKQVDMVKSELDVLDKLIQIGWNTLPMVQVLDPRVLMKAIELKDKITEGSHNHLTNYGFEYLREIEQGKFQAVLQALLSFIPEDRHEAAIQAIEQAEDDYYRTTEYYEEYLTAKNQPIVVEGEYNGD